MRIGVISDSHGNIKSIKDALKDMGKIDLLIHLGDYVKDAIKIEKDYNIKVIFVKGNTDRIKDVDEEQVLDIKGRKIFLTHGHKYNIKHNLQTLFYKSKEKDVDIVLFGHTHIPLYQKHEDIIFLNPGSVGDKRCEMYESYAIMEIDEKEIKIEIKELN